MRHRYPDTVPRRSVKHPGRIMPYEKTHLPASAYCGSTRNLSSWIPILSLLPHAAEDSRPHNHISDPSHHCQIVLIYRLCRNPVQRFRYRDFFPSNLHIPHLRSTGTNIPQGASYCTPDNAPDSYCSVSVHAPAPASMPHRSSAALFTIISACLFPIS